MEAMLVFSVFRLNKRFGQGKSNSWVAITKGMPAVEFRC